MSQGDAKKPKSRLWYRAGRIASFAGLMIILGLAVYFRSGGAPLTAVSGSSMEPALQMGDLVLIQPVNPAQVQEGDVVVVQIPGTVRERFGFPPTFVHRIISIQERSEGGRLFRMQGDNNVAEDPFTVFPEDIRGKVYHTVPHAGYAILFLQSRQGIAFLIAALLVYLLYILSEAVEQRGPNWRRAVSATVSSVLTADLVEHTKTVEARQEQTLAMVNQSLESFAGAMSEYATHLQSHTSAVKGLATGADALQQSVGQHDRVLSRLEDVLAAGRQFDSTSSPGEPVPQQREQRPQPFRITAAPTRQHRAEDHQHQPAPRAQPQHDHIGGDPQSNIDGGEVKLLVDLYSETRKTRETVDRMENLLQEHLETQSRSVDQQTLILKQLQEHVAPLPEVIQGLHRQIVGVEPKVSEEQQQAVASDRQGTGAAAAVRSPEPSAWPAPSPQELPLPPRDRRSRQDQRRGAGRTRHQGPAMSRTERRLRRQQAAMRARLKILCAVIVLMLAGFVARLAGLDIESLL
ncbi:MAG: signal peptidase I [Thermaerobacterales bacterium]